MLRAAFIRLIAAILTSALSHLVLQTARAQSVEDINARNVQAAQLYNQGKYAEAVELAEKTLVLAEKKLGLNHPNTLTSVGNLGALYEAQGRYSEAEPLYRQALARCESAFGAVHTDTLKSVNKLAFFLYAQARYSEAEPLLQRALAGFETALGAEHPTTIESVYNLAAVYDAQGSYGEAEPLFKRSLQSREKTLGMEHPDTLTSVNNLAYLYQRQGRYEEAESLFMRALVGEEKVLGPDHRNTLTSINNLGTLFQSQGRYSEAEPLLKRAVAGYEKALGRENAGTHPSVGNLAALYLSQGRYSEAEPLLELALASSEKTLGPEDPDTLRRVNNLAMLFQNLGRYGEAEPLLKRAVAGYEKALGREHPETLTTENNLAALYYVQGRFSEAEPLFELALAGRERTLGPDHPGTLEGVNNLAMLSFSQRNWQRAMQLWGRSAAAIAKRTERGAFAAELTGKKQSETQQLDWQFWGLVKTAYRLAPDGHAPKPATSAEMFETAQWALSSEAAHSLAQMAVRGAKGDLALAVLVRERQDLVDEWQRREKLQTAALGQETAKRDVKVETDNRERMAAIDARIAEIDAQLKAKFPDYYAKSSAAPASVEEVQAQLRADEALVLFLETPEWKPTPEETFIWVVTKTQFRWLRSDLGGAALTREVAALRCGLDYTAWRDGTCKELTGEAYSVTDYQYGKLPPYDPARAYRLYEALLGGAEDLIKNKTHLLIVPSGALTQLPPHVLVTEPPVTSKPPHWLIRDRAVSILPAVSSLKALRATARSSAAEKPMIGFGNPLLDGPDDRYGARAKAARQKQSCPKTAWERVAGVFGLDRQTKAIITRGLVDPQAIRSAPPLPETADELCAVARQTGADIAEMRLGARATEREVKALSDSGELAHYRVVEFSTHGVMAGQLDPNAEPGLILTPPRAASELDDGYL